MSSCTICLWLGIDVVRHTRRLAGNERRDEVLQQKITRSLKVDKETNMKIVTDVKQELRKANALKINYSTGQGR